MCSPLQQSGGRALSALVEGAKRGEEARFDPPTQRQMLVFRGFGYFYRGSVHQNMASLLAVTAVWPMYHPLRLYCMLAYLIGSLL
jgi:hypothetical protein